MRRKLGYGLFALTLVLVLVLTFGAYGCHGHVIRKPYVPNHQQNFDFTRPPCDPSPRPATQDGDVLVRYLGSGGVYIEWKGVSILTAPFFSNYGLLRAGFGKVRWDEQAIGRGLEELPLEKVRAVIAGHSHYDHIGDLPPIIRRLDRETKVYVNHSGWNMLSKCEGAAGRVVDLEDRDQSWIWLEDNGRRLPVRFMLLESGHAPHTRFYHYAKGEVSEPWENCLTGKRLGAMKAGKTFAFIIDLMSGDGQAVEFRIHYQDAASSRPLGFPPRSMIEKEHPADLAILCMPSSWLADEYPEGILQHTRARHALVTHYEDFFRSREKPLRFVPMLTNRRANRFMERVEREMSHTSHEVTGPDPCVCGPCGEMWTMPLPGEWMRFRARGHVSS